VFVSYRIRIVFLSIPGFAKGTKGTQIDNSPFLHNSRSVSLHSLGRRLSSKVFMKPEANVEESWAFISGLASSDMDTVQRKFSKLFFTFV